MELIVGLVAVFSKFYLGCEKDYISSSRGRGQRAEVRGYLHHIIFCILVILYT